MTQAVALQTALKLCLSVSLSSGALLHTAPPTAPLLQASFFGTAPPLLSLQSPP